MRKAKRKTQHKAAKRQKKTIKRTRPKSSSDNGKWIQGVRQEMERKGTVGLFTKKAKRAGMGVQTYANYVLSHKKKFNRKTIDEALFAKRMKQI